MSVEPADLTPALEDYLETVYELVRDQDHARVRDIAQARGVRAASVTPAMKRLAELGYIRYVQREAISLTPSGEAVARRVLARHQILTRFFEQVIGLAPDEAGKNACAMEHALTDPAMDGLVRFFEYLQVCPRSPTDVLERFHGCALLRPEAGFCGRDCVAAAREESPHPSLSLADIKPGERCRVLQVEGGGAIRQRLLDMGVLPGALLTVERRAPGGDPLWIKLQGFQLALRRREAETIHVSPEDGSWEA